MWLFVALLGNAMLAVVGVMDKFILTKSVSKPVVFVFYSTIFVLPFFLLLPFGVKIPTAQIDYLIFAISGFCFASGLWSMYIGFQKSEISHIGPLIGAAAPLCILFLSRIFLGETLTTRALVAAGILIIGSLVISFDQNVQKRGLPLRQAGWRRGLEWGVLAGFLFAVSHVSAKYAYDLYGFYNGFIFTKLPIGIFGAALLANPSVRNLFRHRHEAGSRLGGDKKSIIEVEKVSRNKTFALVVIDISLGVTATVLLQYAMSLGSVSLVNALSGVQFALLIVLVAIISKFFPHILKETFTRKEIIKKVVAVFIISAGLFLLLA